MPLRDELVTTIVGAGMLRRDVATDVADAILKRFAVSYGSCNLDASWIEAAAKTLGDIALERHEGQKCAIIK